MRHRAADIAAVLSAYALLALFMTWPLALHLGDSLLATDSSALNDAYFCVWILGWQAHQLIADPTHLFDANIFHPLRNTLAFTETIFPGVLAYLPFAYATGNPVLAHNGVLLLSFPLNGFATYLYARDWLGNAAEAAPTEPDLSRAAFLGGLVFAFCTYKIGEVRHIQLLLAMFMPLTLMYLARFMRRPVLPSALLAGLCFALNALASLYYAVFLAFAVALYLAIDGFERRWRYAREHLIYGASALLLLAVVVVPFALPYLRLDRSFLDSAARDPSLFSARPASYLATPSSQWLYGRLTRPFYLASKGQPIFPGSTALALSLVGLIMLRRERRLAWIFPLSLALGAFVLSFGPVLVMDRAATPALPVRLPYYYVSLLATPLKSMAAPARFAVLVMLALSLLAAAGAYALLRRAPRWGRAGALTMAALMLSEYVAVPLPWAAVDAGAAISPAYDFLARQPRGEPVAELPMGAPTFGGQAQNAIYTYNSLYHWLPIVNGYGTFIPREYYALVAEVQSFPSPAAVKRLQDSGVVWLVVHADRYKSPRRLKEELDQSAQLEPVQEFGTIWLYRMRGT